MQVKQGPTWCRGASPAAVVGSCSSWRWQTHGCAACVPAAGLCTSWRPPRPSRGAHQPAEWRGMAAAGGWGQGCIWAAETALPIVQECVEALYREGVSVTLWQCQAAGRGHQGDTNHGLQCPMGSPCRASTGRPWVGQS